MKKVIEKLINKTINELLDIFEMRIEENFYEDENFIKESDKIIYESLKVLNDCIKVGTK